MKRRSPVRLVCERPWLDVGDDMLVCRWTCPAPGATVQFRDRHRPEHFAVLHPSTKRHGKFQVSFFDQHGAVGDVERATCAEALEDAGIDRHWKLEEVGDGQLRARRRR